MRVNDAKLAELEALREKATPGEWRLNTDEGHIYSVTPDMELDVVTIYDYKHSDAELACELRNSASDLIADLREARARALLLENALFKFPCANEPNCFDDDEPCAAEDRCVRCSALAAKP